MSHNQFEHIAVRRVVSTQPAVFLTQMEKQIKYLNDMRKWKVNMFKEKTHKYSPLKPEVHSVEAETSSDFWCNLSSIKIKKRNQKNDQTVKCI